MRDKAKDPEREREYQRRYRLKHKDEIRARAKLASKSPSRKKWLKEWRERRRDKTREYYKKYRTSEAGKAAIARYRLKSKYGLTPDGVFAMLDRQGGACAICGTRDFSPHVDHDHRTGIVRGILCGPCNRSIGLMKENAIALRRAADYLERSRGTE